MLTLAAAYNKSVQEESTLSAQELKTRHVGKQDPKRHLEDAVESAMGDQVGPLHLQQSYLVSGSADYSSSLADCPKFGSHASLADKVVETHARLQNGSNMYH